MLQLQALMDQVERPSDDQDGGLDENERAMSSLSASSQRGTKRPHADEEDWQTFETDQNLNTSNSSTSGEPHSSTDIDEGGTTAEEHDDWHENGMTAQDKHDDDFSHSHDDYDTVHEHAEQDNAHDVDDAGKTDEP